MIPGDGVKVEIAFATAPDDPSPVWVDVTSYVLMSPGISITRGRSPEGGAVTPGTCSLTLKNDDGRFTPERSGSPYYPNVTLGRKIRVSRNGVNRFVGFVDSWPMSWPAGPDLARVSITAVDRMRRIAVKRTKLRSIVEETVLGLSPSAYFPLGEPDGATSAADVSAAGVSGRFVVTQYGSGGTIAFGAGTGPDTDALSAPVFTRADGQNGKSLVATARSGKTYDGSSGVTVAAAVNVASGIGGELFRISNGSQWIRLEVSGGALRLSSVNMLNTPLTRSTSVSSSSTVANGKTRHVAVTASGNTARVYLDGALAATLDTFDQWSTLPDFDTLEIGGHGVEAADSSGSMISATICHVATFAASLSATDVDKISDATLTGFAGERSDQRVARYLDFAGVPAADRSLDTGRTTDVAHIATTDAAPLTLAQQVTDTEAGVLFVDRDGRVVFHSRGRRFGASVAVAFLSSDVKSPELVFDDQRLENDLIVTGATGYAVRVRNTSSITAYGTAEGTLELVTRDEDEVEGVAQWRSAMRSTVTSRSPQLRVDLLSLRDALVGSVLGLEISSRVTVDVPLTQAPSTLLDLFVEGYTESITDTAWEFVLNTSAAVDSGGNALKLDSTTYGTLDAGNRLVY